MPGVFLFFGKGQRPSRRAVVEQLANSDTAFVSHDPVQADQILKDEREAELSSWLELVCHGLTFDVLGLGDGPALTTGPVAHRFGCSADIDGGDFEAIGLFPGPHLAEGTNSLPVVRTMLQLALLLAETSGEFRGAYWSPARSLIGPDLFRRIVGEWLAGGPFPSLGLVGYVFGEDGSMRSDGLAFLADREIALEPALSADRIAAARLAVRVVHLLVGSLPPDHVMPFTFEGREMHLRPDSEGKLIFVELA
ncbi:hypothetical protein [Qipengyuania soli]|uniref:DUF4261 domain-containing protein n=1 Tax=Qipengyuania soli TaxID=2782568 RepID=A0A7S8IVP3_9SPHN|nr:hypothetical protein [Qipengyuania soli]QPC99870.1 hypothetical protein IRL76_04850 [Qipengyuania soli]